MPLFGNRVFANVIIERALNLRALIRQEDTCPYKEGEGHVTHAEIREMWPQAKEHLGTTSSRKRRKDSSRETSEAAWCWHLDFRLLAPRTVREYISVVFSHAVCGVCYNSLGKRVQFLTLAFLFAPSSSLPCASACAVLSFLDSPASSPLSWCDLVLPITQPQIRCGLL